MEMEWIKVNVRMFEDEKLQIINSMPERDVISYVWIRLLLLAGKTNDDGKVYISKKIPYTVQTLSIIIGRSTSVVDVSLEILSKLNMIVIDDNNVIKIKTWNKYQNFKNLEKNREQSKVRMRNKRKRDKEKEIEAFGKDDDECYIDVAEDEQNSLESENKCYANVTKEKNNNVTDVTLKNKKKKENKEKEEELDKDINKKEREKSNVVSLEERKMEEVNEAAVRILNHYESLTGKPGIFKFESIVLAISKYGADNVKMAIDKSIEAGKLTMRYVNGILRNWAKEGYPKEGGPMDGDSGLASDGGKFKGIEPQKPRELTEEERKNSKELI